MESNLGLFFLACLNGMVLAWIAWPINVPLMALAYKVRNGREPLDVAPPGYWPRSTLAAFGVAIISFVFVLLALWSKGAFKTNPTLVILVQLSLLIPLIGANGFFLYWAFALEDMLEGVSLFGIYSLIPALPLAVIIFVFIPKLIVLGI